MGETDPDIIIQYYVKFTLKELQKKSKRERKREREWRAKRTCELLCLGEEERSLQHRWHYQERGIRTSLVNNMCTDTEEGNADHAWDTFSSLVWLGLYGEDFKECVKE